MSDLIKKIVFKNSRNLNLAGNLFDIGSNKIVILAHGFTNNKSSNGRYDRLAEALTACGHDALAFDFSGCGESDDDVITASNQVDDLNSAIEYALSKGYKKISLFGNSFGTLSCLRCFRKEINSMVLTGALTDSMNYNWKDYYSEEQLKKLDATGFFFVNSPPGRVFKINKQTLLDFEQINQKELVEKITCPVLIIHGDNIEDEEEIQLLERSKQAIKLLPDTSRLEIIAGGRHGLRPEWDTVISLTCNWYKKYCI